MKSIEELRTTDSRFRSAEFSSFVRHLMRARGNPREAAHFAETARAPSAVVEVLRAAVTAAGAGWGSELAGYNQLVGAFTAELRHSSVFYAMLGAMVRVPFQTRLAAIMSSATAGTIPPGGAISVSNISAAAIYIDRVKAAGIMVMSRELLDSGVSAEAVISRELRSIVSEAADREFLALLGTPVSVASSGSPLADVRAMLQALAPTADSRLFWAASPSVGVVVSTAGEASAGSPSTPTGTQMFPTARATGASVLLDFPLVVSAAVSGLMLFDAARVAASSDPVEIDVSRQASLEMSTAPTMSAGAGSPATPAGADAVSMFQTNSVALRAIAYLGAQPIRATPVVQIDPAW